MATKDIKNDPNVPKFGTHSQTNKPPNTPPPFLYVAEYVYAVFNICADIPPLSCTINCKNIQNAQNSKTPAKNLKMAK